MNKFKGMTMDEKKDFLKDYYIFRRLTLQQIATLSGVTKEAIHYWVKKFKLNETKLV